MMNAWLRFLLIIVVVGFLIWLLDRCFGEHSDKTKKELLNYNPREFVFTVKEGVSDLELRQKLAAATGDTDFQLERCECDTLILVRDLDGVGRIEGHDGDLAIKPAGTGVSSDFINTTRNYFITPPDVNVTDVNMDTLRSQIRQWLPTQSNSGEPILIAVLDSGLDTTLIPNNSDYMWRNTSPEGCYTNARWGWNFIEGSPTPFDNHPKRHGTVVSGIILRESKNANVKLMPLKVLDQHNNGELFNLLCAVQFAKRHNARILNMSLGGYLKGETDTLYKRVLKDLAQDNRTFIVAAAGNSSRSSSELENDGRRPALDSVQLRDLDLRKYAFYPANFSKTYRNLISVTSVYFNDKTADVCDNQNYSDEVVNVGVFSAPTQNLCNFLLGGIPMSGSSFAAPIASGRLAVWLASNPGAGNNRNVVLNTIPSYGPLLENRVERKRVWTTQTEPNKTVGKTDPRYRETKPRVQAK